MVGEGAAAAGDDVDDAVAVAAPLGADADRRAEALVLVVVAAEDDGDAVLLEDRYEAPVEGALVSAVGAARPDGAVHGDDLPGGVVEGERAVEVGDAGAYVGVVASFGVEADEQHRTVAVGDDRAGGEAEVVEEADVVVAADREVGRVRGAEREEAVPLGADLAVEDDVAGVDHEGR